MAYRIAKEAQAVADELIETHHAHLTGVTVTAVFVDKTPTSKGRQVWARAKKISGLNAFLAAAAARRHVPGSSSVHEYGDEPHDFFVIEVAEEVWRKLTEKGREALIDEALCSCEIEWDEEGPTAKLAVVGPDISAFSEAVKRRGLWREDLEEFVRASARQLAFDAIDETGAVEEGEKEAGGRVGSSGVLGEVEGFVRAGGADVTVLHGGRSS